MSRPPRDASEPIVASKHWVGIAAYGALLAATVLGAMAIVGVMGASAAQSTSVGFMTLALSQLWHVFNMRGPGTRMVRNDVVGNPWVWGAIVLCLALLAAAAFFGPLATVLDVVPLSPSLWAVVVGTSLAPLVVGQIVLALRRG